jgi:hypothetical protein
MLLRSPSLVRHLSRAEASSGARYLVPFFFSLIMFVPSSAALSSLLCFSSFLVYVGFVLTSSFLQSLEETPQLFQESPALSQFVVVHPTDHFISKASAGQAVGPRLDVFGDAGEWDKAPEWMHFMVSVCVEHAGVVCATRNKTSSKREQSEATIPYHVKKAKAPKTLKIAGFVHDSHIQSSFCGLSALFGGG